MGLGIVWGAFLLPGLGRAEEMHLTAGYKLWYSDWVIKLGGEKFTSEFEMAGAPSIHLRRGKVFAGATLTAGSVDFPQKKNIVLENPEDNQIVRRVSGNADWVQMETGVGYYVTPSFGPYLGYLFQAQEYEFRTDVPDKDIKGDQDLGTVLIGLVWSRPILSPRTVFYVNGAVMGLFGGDVRGEVAEVGAAYAVEKMPVSLSGGLKYQEFRYQKDILILNGNSREKDTRLGITLGVHYTF